MSSLDRMSLGPKPKSGWRRAIERLGPYQSLALLAVPLCVVEPAKLVAVAIAGKGHWITGTGMLVAAYAVSILVVERLFLIVKPKLLMVLEAIHRAPRSGHGLVSEPVPLPDDSPSGAG
jgi:hypothetical protein